MSPVDTPLNAAEAETRRLALMADVRDLETQMRGTNRKVSFADIRDQHPAIAEALFRGRDIRMTDFGNSDLAFIDFRGSDLSGCDFGGATLQGARFEFAKVSREQLRLAHDWDTYCRRWQPEPVNRDGEPLDPVFFSRRAGERFSLSPHLPELVVLNHDMLGSAAMLTAEENAGLATGRLAIALKPVTNAEFAHALGAESLLRPDSGRNPREMHSVRSYLAGVNVAPSRFGLPAETRAYLPSDGLMFALARQSTCSPDDGHAALSTDIIPGNLAVGCTGREFVRLSDAAEIGSIMVSGTDRAQLTRETANRPALVRPLFVLGA